MCTLMNSLVFGLSGWVAVLPMTMQRTSLAAASHFALSGSGVFWAELRAEFLALNPAIPALRFWSRPVMRRTLEGVGGGCAGWHGGV